MNRRNWLLLGLVLTTGPAFAQNDEPGEEPPDRFAALREKAGQLIAGMQQLSDWDTHYAYMIDSVERVYERNDWVSEPDLFSLDLMREVERIPPWQVRERMDAAFEIVGDRYLLDESQTQKLRQLVIRENVKLFSKHADRVMDYALDAISTRAAGEPFTPEQVARWVELAEPVFNDSRESFNRTATEFMHVLGPEQRELLQADIAAANQRIEVVAKMTERWKRGEWTPEQWGMEDDPIQNSRTPVDGQTLASAVQSGDGESAGEAPGATDGRRVPATPTREGARPTGGQAGEPPARAGAPAAGPPADRPDRKPTPTGEKQQDDEWTRYVKEFIAKYKLNDEQQQRAWLFHVDAKKRGDATRARFDRLTADLKGAEDPRAKERLKDYTEQQAGDLNRLFERLKSRLEQLPTRAQRRAAEPAATSQPRP